MERQTRRAGRALGVLLVSWLVSGSIAGGQIPKMQSSPYMAASDQALLVFSRPRRRQASDVTYRIVTEAGRCIAVLEDGWQMVAPLSPGTHMLMVITGTTPPTIQLLQAKLSAGKTYVVRLSARVSVKSPVKISIVRRSDQPLEAFPSAIRDLLPAKPDLRRCTEWVSWKRAKIEARALQAKQRWDEASDEHRDSHTVRRNDGWTSPEVVER